MKSMKFINYILNLLYPNVCGMCDNISKEDICPKCILKLNNIALFKIDTYKNKNFKRHLYIFKYEGIIKDRLISFKFFEKSYIYKSFVKFIIKNKKFCEILKSYDIIIPVPIHYKRYIVRGYNQSALIAKNIAKNIKVEYCKDVLFKKINNKPQSTKNSIERKENVIGVYDIKNMDKIKNKNILLLDDIYTTGSTANECAKILKNKGANRVDIITIAKD